MAKSKLIRSSKELREIIDYIRAKYLLAGKRPPSFNTITRKIAKKIDKEELYFDEFIKF